MIRKLRRLMTLSSKDNDKIIHHTENQGIKQEYLKLEMLESRVLLSLLPPNPIDPSSGEFNLMNLVNDLPINDIFNALDHFPIPYTVVASSGDGDPVVDNWKAGNSFVKLDVDNDTGTGKGGSGKDIMVSVKTELLPTPHLMMEIERLGSAPYAEDVTVLVAFPFAAFNSELTLPGNPNLFLGYQSTAPGGTEGGYAPEFETIRFIPEVLAGTDHLFEMVFETSGDDNPLEFIVGHFDGDNIAGILNATAISAHVETADQTVPDTISVALDVNSSFPLGSPLSGSVDLIWDASETADVIFTYQENELGDAAPIDYSTFLWVSPMPVHEELSLSISENPGFNLSHSGSSVIDELAFQHEREDGLLIFGQATDIPTEVGIFIDVDGTQIDLDVNANTMDIQIELIKDGGFINTTDVLGFDVGYLMVRAEDVPDLSAGYDSVLNQFSIAATNPGESIPLLEAVVDDDAAYDESMTNVVGLELPPSWDDIPAHHIFSFVEDGTHGTAAARLVHVVSATLNFGAADYSEAFQLVTSQAAPLQFYVKFSEDSNFIPGDPNLDIEITGDIDDIPAGLITFNYAAPFDFSYATDPPQGIDTVHFFGHIGTLNFDLFAGDLPPIFAFAFDPEGSMSIVAEDGYGGPDTVGFVAARLWDELGPGIPDTNGLFGVPLRDAQLRVDEIPSFTATWIEDAAGTNINFDTNDVDAVLEGVQLAVSTEVEFNTPMPVADTLSDHMVILEDEGAGGIKLLKAVILGIDSFEYESIDATHTLNLYLDQQQARVFVLDVDSGFGGQYFNGDEVTIDVTIDAVPQLLDLTTVIDPSISYDASGPISSIVIMANLDDSDDAVDNGTHLVLEVQDLPASVTFTWDADSGISLVAEDVVNNPDVIGLILGHFYDNDGLTGTAAIFGGTPVSEARIRLDEVPSLNATWNNSNGVVVTFSTTGVNVFLAGMQVAISSDVDLAALAIPNVNTAHYARVIDLGAGERKELSAGVFGMDEFSLDTSSSLVLHYDADAQRLLNIEIDRRFDGAFFPPPANYDYDLDLIINSVPQTFNLTSDLKTGFDYTASNGIDAVTLNGTVDDTNDSTDNGTDIEFILLGLPSEVNVDVDPANHARLTMNNSLDLILLSLSSDNDIFGSGFRLIEASISDIPAKFNADWGGNGFLVETTNAADNPQPLGTLAARVSTSNVEATNNDKVAPFTLNGDVETDGLVLNGANTNGTRIHYSKFLQEIDHRYYNSSGATGVFQRLRDLYAGSKELDDGEDHVIARMEGGSVDYASFQYTGFQHVSWTPDANGGNFIFRNPTPGLHPLFAGYEDGDFTTMQIANIPDEIVVDIDDTGAITYNAADDVEPSILQIDMYQGPLPKAHEDDSALRVIMNDTPIWATLNWDFSLSDGGVLFDSSNQFEVLFLSQSATSSRIVAGLQLQDISVEWGYSFPFDLDLDWAGPIPYSADLRVFEAHAGIYSSGVDGFFSQYDWVGSPAALNTGTGPDGGEFVPEFTVMLKNFTEFSISGGIDVEFFPAPGKPEVDLTINGPTGNLVFDFWTSTTEDWSTTIPWPFDLDIGFRNVADYIDNTPIHIIPFGGLDFDIIEDLVFTFQGFHGWGGHFDPYA